MNAKQKKPAHARKKNLMVNKYTETQKPAAPMPTVSKQTAPKSAAPTPTVSKQTAPKPVDPTPTVSKPTAPKATFQRLAVPDPDPVPTEQMDIVIVPQGMQTVRKLAQEVHASRAENQRQFSNFEELLDDREQELFDQLQELIEKNQHELHAENRKLRKSLEDLMEVLDRHLHTWFRVLQEKLQHHTEREGDRLLQSVDARLVEHERNVRLALNSLAKSSKSEAESVTAALERLAGSFETDAEPEAGGERKPMFKLGDRINVFVGNTPIGGTGSFISMNDEVLVWFDSTAHVRFQSLIDSDVSIQRV